MLTKLRALASLYRQLGLRWLTFRFAYAFRLRAGLIRLQTPSYKWADRPLVTWLKKNIPQEPQAYVKWRKQNSPKFFFDFPPITLGRNTDAETFRHRFGNQLAVDEANGILNGEIKYFSHEFQKTGFPPNWHTDPVSGIKLDPNKHWSRLSDDGEVDIKFIWEAGRFGFVYTLVRAYASSRDERYAEAFWQLIQSWADSNPPNQGANWMDGQEISLRLMAWCFGFYGFWNSAATTPERVAQFIVLVAAQAQRIHRNIDYAISTRSNHTISEAFGLWMVGLLFPELKDSGKYFLTGSDLLEQEAVKQIFPDGSYSMYSLNYHRFVMQIYLYAMRLGELNAAPLSAAVYRVATASVDYLYQLINPQTGQMPVYGSNDGALILPLNSCDFTDYRPVLQLGSFITKGKRLFEPGAWDEDLYWLCGSKSLYSKMDAPEQTSRSFSNGGAHILHGANSNAIIRCTVFQERPSHADQLHVDIWWRGNNIACDAGTYLYSGKGIWRNRLAHSSAHNTVTIDSQDQMKLVSRFVWADWAQGKVFQQGAELWQGGHNGYSRLPDPVSHIRTVLMLADDRWLVLDHLNGKQSHHYALHWLINDFPYTQNDNSICLWPSSNKYKIQTGSLNGNTHFSVVRADSRSARGWRSKYYGQKEPAISMMLEADRPQVVFWTLFGFEGDLIEVEGNMITISAEHWRRAINATELIQSI